MIVLFIKHIKKRSNIRCGCCSQMFLDVPNFYKALRGLRDLNGLGDLLLRLGLRHGAGGGGYLYMVAKDPEAAARIRQTLTAARPNANARFVEMTLSKKGLQVSRS